MEFLAAEIGLGKEELQKLALKLSIQIPLAQSIDSYIANAGKNERLLAKLMILSQLLSQEHTAHIVGHPKSQQLTKVEETNGTLHPLETTGHLDFSKLQTCWHMDFFRNLVGTYNFDELDQRFSEFDIINFNYDRILEHFLFHAIKARYQVGDQAIADLMTHLTMTRPYGKLGNLPWEDSSQDIPFGCALKDINNPCEQADSIKTVSEGLISDKVPLNNLLNEHTEKIIFLGFGFGSENYELIPKPTKGKRSVYTTCLNFSDYREKILTEKIQPLINTNDFTGNIHTINGTCEDLLFEYGLEIFA